MNLSKRQIKLILLVCIFLFLIVVGIIAGILYEKLVFHNLFLQNLSIEQIDTINLYNLYQKGESPLPQKEAEAVLTLINQIALNKQPYPDYGLMGGTGPFYHVVLKNGIEFQLSSAISEECFFIFNNEFYYSIGNYNDSASEQVILVQEMVALYDSQIRKYYPEWFQ